MCVNGRVEILPQPIRPTQSGEFVDRAPFYLHFALSICSPNCDYFCRKIDLFGLC